MTTYRRRRFTVRCIEMVDVAAVVTSIREAKAVARSAARRTGLS